MPWGGGAVPKTGREEEGVPYGAEDEVLIAELEVDGGCEIPDPVGTIVWLQKLCCHASYRAVSFALQLEVIQSPTTPETGAAHSAAGEYT